MTSFIIYMGAIDKEKTDTYFSELLPSVIILL